MAKTIGSFDLETFINFTNYLTSVDFSETSKLKKLQINLNNSIFKYEQCKEYLERLLIEHPKNLTQISNNRQKIIEILYLSINSKYFSLSRALLFVPSQASYRMNGTLSVLQDV